MAELTVYGVPIVKNPRHQMLADQYLLLGSQTQAAINAGYSRKTAGTIAAQILGKPDVAAYVQYRRDEMNKIAGDMQAKIVRELEAMAFSSIGNFITIDEEGKPQVDFTGATPEQLRAITSVQSKTRKIYTPKGEHIATEQESRFSMADKYKGLELLGKHVGMFKEAETRVVVDVADRLLRARARLEEPKSVEGGDIEDISVT